VRLGYIPWASGTRRNAICALGNGALWRYDEKNDGPTRDLDEDPVGCRDGFSGFLSPMLLSGLVRRTLILERRSGLWISRDVQQRRANVIWTRAGWKDTSLRVGLTQHSDDRMFKRSWAGF
jgi:hypothetical protein